MTLQNQQQPMTQPLSAQVSIEIDDNVTIHVTPPALQYGESKAIPESGDLLMSGERITFTKENDREKELAYMEFERAQLQLFIAICKVITVKFHYRINHENFV